MGAGPVRTYGTSVVRAGGAGLLTTNVSNIHATRRAVTGTMRASHVQGVNTWKPEKHTPTTRPANAHPRRPGMALAAARMHAIHNRSIVTAHTPAMIV
jgi:hypothetical protein